jgi:fructose-1,6-bisphosphatase/sedoheptulose 1,7-bisphosphatase-like protein
MAWTYDVTTDAGKVRLLISDTDVTGGATNAIFDDSEIDAFLGLGGENVYLAAAHALDTIASNEVQVLKVMTILDIQTDGAKVSTELRARAKDLRDQADKYADDVDGGFDIAELVVNPQSYYDRLVNQALREQ